MKDPHPEYYNKWLAYQRPWYAKGVIASPYTPKPVVIPKAMKRHPYYAAKWRAQARPYYVSPPAQRFQPSNIPVHIGPNIQPTNPEILVREEIRMPHSQWSHYRPYKGWPLRKPARQVNV